MLDWWNGIHTALKTPRRDAYQFESDIEYHMNLPANTDASDAAGFQGIRDCLLFAASDIRYLPHMRI
jgi:hypothetical protein